MTHLALLLALALQDSPSHAALHPADAELFLAVPDVQAVLASYEETAAVRILREERVRAFLAQLGADAQADPRAALAGFVDAWLPGGGGAELVDALRAASVSKVTREGGRAGALAILELASDEHAGRARSLLLSALGAEVALDAAAVPALGGANVDARGLRLHAAPDVPAWIATRGTRVALGVGSATLGRHVERAAGRVAAEETFAGAELFARGRAAFRAGGGATVFWLVEDHPPLASLFASSSSGWPLAVRIPPRWLAAIDPFEGAHAVRMQLDGGRFATEILTTDRAESVTHGVRPIDPRWLDVVPAGTMVVYSTAVDGSAFAHEARELVTTLAGAGDVVPADEDSVAALAAAAGAACARLGPGMVVYAFPVTGIGLPQSFVCIELAEPESFTAAVAEIVARAEGAVPGLSARTRDYRVKVASGERVAIPVTTLTLPEEALALGPMLSVAPSFAVVEDRLLVGLSSMHVKRELKRLLGGETDVPEGDATGALARHGFALPEDARSVLVVDWGAQIEAALGLVRSLAAILGDDLPFDPEALPEATDITRHMRPTFHVSRRLGDASYTYHEASFGPEVWAALAVGLADQASALVGSPDEASDG